MTENDFEQDEIDNKRLLDNEIKEIRLFIKLLFKAMYLGTCFILIIVPLKRIFG